MDLSPLKPLSFALALIGAVGCAAAPAPCPDPPPPPAPAAPAAAPAPPPKPAPALSGEFELVSAKSGKRDALTVAELFFGEDAKKCPHVTMRLTLAEDSVVAKVEFVCNLYGGDNPLHLMYCKLEQRAALRWGDQQFEVPAEPATDVSIVNVEDRLLGGGESRRNTQRGSCSYSFPKVPVEIVAREPAAGPAAKVTLRVEDDVWQLERAAAKTTDEEALIQSAADALRGGK